MTHTEEENFDLEFDPDGDNDGDDDNGNEMSNGKECTGRWTREEHQLFVKGLEAYGKGWKKIASLIKTRTVVQIRTHAQKYFLKLSKARQNGELAGGLGQYGFRKRRLRRRYGDRPISIAPMLQPFLKPSSSSENLEPADIEDGIYNFLSANLEVVSEEGVADSDETPNVSPPMELSEGDISSLALPSSPQSSSSLNRKKVDYKKLVPPLWYKKGQGLDVLLREAEGLDWSEDVQGRLENQNNGAETILTSNKTPAKEEKVEIEQNMQAGSEKRKASEESSQGTWRQKSGNTQGLQSESLHESKIRRLSSESLTTLMNSYQAVEIHHSSPHNTVQKRRVEADDAVGFNIDEDIEQPLDNGGGHHNCHESSVADDHLDVFFDNSYFGLHGADKDKTSTKTTTFLE